MCVQSLKYLAPILLALLLGGCPGRSTPGPVPTGGDVTNDSGGGDGNTDEGATGDVTGDNSTAGDQPAGNGNADSTSGGGDVNSNPDNTPAGPVSLSGHINPGQAAKRRARLQGAEVYPYTVVVQSDATGETYRGETSPDGEFKIDLPAEEHGNSLTATILAPDGQAVGPVVLDAAGGEGVTGLAMDRDADLGTIDLPDDPTQAPIVPGGDSDVADLLDPSVTARLNADGAPVGLASVGKGAEADASGIRDGAVDADGDGLIDMLDADDDGDGVVDDFDTSSPAPVTPPDTHVNFFMNLKIGADFAPTYYEGSTNAIATRLATDTVITLEVMTEPFATRSITRAGMRETPGPSYLPIAQKTGNGGSGALWASTNYAFDPLGDRWGVWIIPNAVMEAGDTFTLDVSYDDGTTEQYSRMINYVFKNIPKLIEYGAAGSMTAFALGSGEDGTPSHPLEFGGTKDLVLVYEPPPDDTGAPITGTDYSFQFSFCGSGGAGIGGNDIDYEATWPTPIPNLDRSSYWVRAADLGDLSAEGTYTVTLPKGIFVDSVTLNSAAVEAISSYKIDITADAPTGNAAIMLTFVKQ
jgi:hypothetical protein